MKCGGGKGGKGGEGSKGREGRESVKFHACAPSENDLAPTSIVFSTNFPVFVEFKSTYCVL